MSSNQPAIPMSIQDWHTHKQDFNFLQILVQPGYFTLCRLPTAADLPQSVANLMASPSASRFCNSLTRTENETSILLTSESLEASVALEQQLKEEIGPGEGHHVDGGWKCLKVRGPMKFDLVGVMRHISSALAEDKISLFCISTWDTDYILVKRLTEAISALRKDGWTVLE